MKREIRALTGIRGLAACYVVLFHYFFGAIGLTHVAPVITFLRHGYLSVDLFFCLSGYIMAETYGADFRQGPSWASFKKFLGRRLARTYPLYFATTLVMAILITIHDGIQPISFYSGTLLWNICLTQTWGIVGNGGSLNGPAWSVSAEAAAYLLFPVLSLLTLFRSSRLAVLCGIVALGTVISLALLPTHLLISQ